MDIVKSDYFFNKSFYILFHDAVNYLNESDASIDGDNYEKVQRYGRASIISSTLLIECCANCCVDTLKLSKSYKNEIDKLPPLSKYEFFLSYHHKNKTLDRGCLEIQNVSESKNIRDFIVHPKVKRAKWERIDDSTRQVSFGKTKALKFPKEIERWDRNYALIALRTICSFLDYFFLNLCEFDTNTIKKILISPDEFNSNPKVGIGTPDEWIVHQAKWLLRLEFIGIKSKNARTI